MKKTTSFLLLLCILHLDFFSAWSQKRLAVIGSSTAACHGFSAQPDSCYINRVVNYYGINDAAHYLNRAVDGMGVSSALPDSFVNQSYNGESLSVDSYRNISTVMGQNSYSPQGWQPDVVLVNYPTNNYDWEDIHNIMFYFRTIRDYATGLGAVVYVTTSQPRSSFDSAGRAKLKIIKDSILEEFGDYAIDFWTGLAVDDGTANTGNIIAGFGQGDGIHLNAAGHDTLFQRVIAKNIFGLTTPLPVKLLSFTGNLQSKQPMLQWITAEESPGTHYLLQRSANGADFTTIADIKGQGLALDNQYQYTDAGAQGSVFYRLQVVETSQTTYSKVLHFNLPGSPAGFSIEKLFPVPAAGSQLTLQVQSAERQTVHIEISSVPGSIVQSFDQSLGSGSTLIPIALNSLNRGMYFLKISNTVAGTFVQKFVRN